MTIPKYLIDILKEVSNGQKLSVIVKRKGLSYKKTASQLWQIRDENDIRTTAHLVAEMIRRKIIT